MFLGLPDPDPAQDPGPDPIVIGTDPALARILPFSHKGVERADIMLFK
jgi:hypothetical protein